jgi:hypothetical protein
MRPKSFRSGSIHRAGGRELICKIWRTMVYDGVEAQFVPGESAFRLAAGNSDSASTLDAGDLAD